MTKVKVENKSRKQTVKVKTNCTKKAPTTSGGDANPKSLLSRIDELEKQVSTLNELVIKLTKWSIEDDLRKFKLRQEIDDNRKIYLKFAWGLWAVFVIFVVVFGIVLN